MLTEKSTGSSFTDSLPRGNPPWLLDPADAPFEAVELAGFGDVRGLLSFPAVAAAAHHCQARGQCECRHITRQGSYTLPAHRFSSAIAALRAVVFAPRLRKNSPIFAGPFISSFHVTWFT